MADGGHFIEREPVIRPRHEGGLDWGAPRRVIAISPAGELWWWRAHKSWVGLLLGYQHAPAELIFVPLPRSSGAWSTIQEGGRLSLSLLRQHDGQIARLLQVPRESVAAWLHARGTFVWIDSNSPERQAAAQPGMDPTGGAGATSSARAAEPPCGDARARVPTGGAGANNSTTSGGAHGSPPAVSDEPA